MTATRAKNAAVGNAIAKLNATQLIALSGALASAAGQIDSGALGATLPEFEAAAKDALRTAFGVTSAS